MHFQPIHLLVLLMAALLLFGRKRLPDLAEHLADAMNKFRGGGPGSPTGPIPSNDSRILNRKRKREA